MMSVIYSDLSQILLEFPVTGLAKALSKVSLLGHPFTH
jgi:predicted amidohydrolase